MLKSEHKMEEPFKLNAYQHIACASVAGCIGNVVGFPLDTIKVRMQTSTKNIGVWNCTKNIIRKEGFARLYGGISAQLTVASLLQSVVFGTNRFFNHMLDIDRENIVSTKDYVKMLGSGSMTGLCLSVCVTPFEQAKILVQSGKADSPWKSSALIYKTKGLKGLYRGWLTTAAREVLYYAPYFFTYDSLRCFFKSKREAHHDHKLFSPIVITESLVSGGIAGCVGWFVILPTDYIKSRMQSDNVLNPQYRSIWDCVRQTYRSGGVRQFYVGLGLTLFRAFPVHATVFLTMEVLKSGIMMMSQT
jgi:hypothetical protein